MTSGEQGPSTEDIEIAALRDEIAALQEQIRELNQKSWEPEFAARIVDGYAKEAAYSGERHVLELVAKAIRESAK